MVKQPILDFDPQAYLANGGLGKTVSRIKAKQRIYAQGDECDAIYYIQAGRVKLTVVSAGGKEAALRLLGPTDFVGDEAIAAVCGLRLASATTLTGCSIMKISRVAMLKVLCEEPAFQVFYDIPSSPKYANTV